MNQKKHKIRVIYLTHSTPCKAYLLHVFYRFSVSSTPHYKNKRQQQNRILLHTNQLTFTHTHTPNILSISPKCLSHRRRYVWTRYVFVVRWMNFIYILHKHTHANRTLFVFVCRVSCGDIEKPQPLSRCRIFHLCNLKHQNAFKPQEWCSRVYIDQTSRGIYKNLTVNQNSHYFISFIHKVLECWCEVFTHILDAFLYTHDSCIQYGHHPQKKWPF